MAEFCIEGDSEVSHMPGGLLGGWRFRMQERMYDADLRKVL
jgi:hypothetical protein